MHTPFDAVDDGFDNGSSAFLREEADEIYFIVYEEVCDEDGRGRGGFSWGCRVTALGFRGRRNKLRKEKGSSFLNCLCAPPGARTLDPNIKSVVLYQLS